MFFLLFGTAAWWWIFLDLLIIAFVIGLVETDHPIVASLLLFILTPALLHFFGDFNVYRWAWEHLDQVITYAVGYVAVGFVWSYVKYVLQINSADFQKRLRDVYEVYSSKYSVEEWAAKSDFNPAHPLNATMRSRLLGWWGWWPVSVFSTLSRVFFLRLFENLFNLLRNVYMLAARAAVKRAFKE